MNNNLGETLREKRKSKKLTLKQVTDLSGVSGSHLSRIERGERFPSGHILMKLVEPLGFTEVELLRQAGFLSRDESDDRIDRFKKEIKLEVTGALMRIFDKIDSF